MRKTPVIVFINKLDRPSHDAFDILDDVEKELQIKVNPLSWPIGNGDTFKGIYNLHRQSLCLYSPVYKIFRKVLRFQIPILRHWINI